MDHYQVLGLTRSANDIAIQNAYRKNALKWHPDKRGSSPEVLQQFSQVSEAYNVLSNKKKRAIFDKFGTEGLRGPGSSVPTDAYLVFERFFGTSNPFATILEAKMGGENDPYGEMEFGRSRMSRSKKNNTTRRLSLSLEELYCGCTKRIKVERKRRQPGGNNLRSEQKFLTVKVSPGWRRGTNITFENEGDEALNGSAGDVVFIVSEKEHSEFQRRESNLHFSADLTLAQALTDFTIDINHLDGRVLSIPCNEIISPGYTKVVPGEGMPISKEPGKNGDLVIEFNVVFPEKLSTEQKSSVRKALQ